MFKDFVVSHCGSPEDYGARKPPENIFEAGLALSQHFLPLVAEGRIHVKPWIAEVNGRQVRFEDGTSEEFDAILFGTGFPLHLPFLGSDIRAALDIEGHFADLFQFTFHPELPGLAFVGMMELQGPYFPVLELQARWIAYTWSGAVPEVPAEMMEEGIRAARSMRGRSPMVPMNQAAVGFARLAGIEPSLSERPELGRALLFGPLVACLISANGKDSLANAPDRVAEDARGVRGRPESSADANATDATARAGQSKRRSRLQPFRREPERAEVIQLSFLAPRISTTHFLTRLITLKVGAKPGILPGLRI